MTRFFVWLLDHRPLVFLACAAVVAASWTSASGVRVDYAIEQLFPTTGAIRENFEEYRRSFPDEDARFSLVWQITRAPDRKLYRNLEHVALQFEEVGLRDVHWFGSVPFPEATEFEGEPGVVVHPLVEEAKLSDAYVAATLARHRTNNLYSGYLWNADQTAFGVHGYLPEDRREDVERRLIEQALTERLAEIDDVDATFALAGIPVIRSRLPKLLEADQRVFLGAGLVLFVALLAFFFRSGPQVFLCLASTVPAYLLTLGVMGFAGYSISVLSSFIPIIILVVSVSDSIHLLSGFRATRRGGSGKRGGSGQREAVIETFSGLAGTCFYTSLTTAVGFLSLAGTRIGIVVEFGVFTAIAIMAAFVFNMTLLPVLLSYHSAKTFNDRGLRHRWLQGVIGSARVLAFRPSVRTLALFLLVSVLGIAASRGLRTNTLLLDDMRPRSGLLKDLRWVEDQGFGLFQVVLYMKGAEGQELHDPQVLRWMREFQEFAQREPLVMSTVGLPDFLEQIRTAFGEDGETRGEDSEARGGLPRTTEEASQLLFLAQLEDADFSDLVYRPAEREAQIIVSVEDEGSTLILPFLDRVDRYLIDNPPPAGSVVPTGTVYLLQSYQAQIIKSFVPTIAIAIVLITGILIFMFRSITLGLVALIPNLFPLLVLLAFMAVCSFDVKPSTILVFSIAFGIAVDDSMHLLGRIRDRLRRGDRMRGAIQASLRDGGPAIVIATLVVGLGFSLLIGSQFEVLFLVGLMTVVSAVAALFADLYALPAILLALAPIIERRMNSSETRRASTSRAPTSRARTQEI
jgi:predicted RND superfamily exporter protein